MRWGEKDRAFSMGDGGRKEVVEKVARTGTVA
jgi:hypothetical protein